jgi:hypothetical protein
MNLREIINFQEGYNIINREERNLAAIFYHALLVNDNLNRFLKHINCNFPVNEKELGIYFEYAYLRDLWHSIENNNSLKRKVILSLLKPKNHEFLENAPISEFNKYFGAVRKRNNKLVSSNDYIESPSNWSMIYYNDTILDNEEFLKVCYFKWSFNAKPDIVIHTTHNHAICIEAKLVSGEGSYPSNNIEKDIFKKRNLKYVGQLSIQENIMEELLGIETNYIFLVRKKPSLITQKELTWKDAFGSLDTSSCPNFIKDWIERKDII